MAKSKSTSTKKKVVAKMAKEKQSTKPKTAEKKMSKTPTKRKNSPSPEMKTPKSKVSRSESTTPDTQGSTPASGSSKASKTSIIRKCFKTRLTFDERSPMKNKKVKPPKTNAKTNAAKARTNTKTSTKLKAKANTKTSTKPKAKATTRAKTKATTKAKAKSEENTKTTTKLATKAKTISKTRTKSKTRSTSSLTKIQEKIQCHQVDWLHTTGLKEALMVNDIEFEEENDNYSYLLDVLLKEFSPSKIATSYAALSNSCNVCLAEINMDKDFATGPKARKMMKEMLINHYNATHITIDSSEDEQSK